MLEPIMDSLNKQRIILASSSPRRREILESIGLKFEVIPSNYEEDLNPDDFSDPSEFVIATAINKVKEVDKQLSTQSEKYDILVGVDTIVYLTGRVYGKPKNNQEAFSMLKEFSGNCHTVYSGVCIKTSKRMVTFTEATKVHFGQLNNEIIDAYVKSGEPLDKAGGYGIQKRAGSFIEKIEGDYFNVVGLPLYKFCTHLNEIILLNEGKNC